MNELRDWHPVALEKDLREKPMAVKVLGDELVLFRTGQGQIGAVPDVCPHRRMRLSCGAVHAGRLTCPYHGWNFGVNGDVRSPANPQLNMSVDHFEVQSKYGAVWLRALDSSKRQVPDLEQELGDVALVATTRHRFSAPLELVLDNFAELEHAARVHIWFGFDEGRASDVKPSFRVDGDTLRFSVRGPQRGRGAWLARPLGVQKSDHFETEWNLRFRPVHGFFRSRWWSSDGRTKRRPELPVSIFFVPVDDQQTDLYSFYFLPRSLSALVPVLRPIVTLMGSVEVYLDQRIVGRLADKSPDLRGMRLGRFDKPLAAVRHHLKTIYRNHESEGTEGVLSCRS